MTFKNRPVRRAGGLASRRPTLNGRDPLRLQVFVIRFKRVMKSAAGVSEDDAQQLDGRMGEDALLDSISREP